MNLTWSDFTFLLRFTLDILVIWLLIYSALRLVRNNNRTIQIVKGILIIVIIKGIAVVLGLHTLSYLLNIFLNWGVVAVLILFQPEIRGMLERVGKTSPFFSNNISAVRLQQMVDDLVASCTTMSSSKTGALISIQQTQSLQDYIETGTKMDSDVSQELINTIFQYGTPLHDGAVIIQGVKIACAGAYFPPTNQDLPSRYGARHRAAVGISEITDSITIIVSEETGDISVAIHGTLTKYSPEALKRFLTNKLVITDEVKHENELLGPVYKTARRVGINLPNRQSRQQQEKVQDERIKPLEVVNLLDDEGGDRK